MEWGTGMWCSAGVQKPENANLSPTKTQKPAQRYTQAHTHEHTNWDRGNISQSMNRREMSDSKDRETMTNKQYKYYKFILSSYICNCDFFTLTKNE